MRAGAALPAVSIRSLGGTVAMTSGAQGGGATPTIGAQAMVQAVPAVHGVAVIEAVSVCSVPSASLGLTQLLECLESCDRACTDGADGVVVTLGTDTMEEVAFFLDLLWDRPEPVVLTGAMRPADVPGADGPANLIGAVRVAASPLARGRGCLVVMNDEVHAARNVRKTHTTSPSAFASASTGPVGRLHENVVVLDAPAPRRHPPLRLSSQERRPRVALVRLCLADDPDLLEFAVNRYDGVVVETFGGGHVPGPWVAPLLAAGDRLPVVLASRVATGPLLTSTYDFFGSERTLMNGGLVWAGALDGTKARILLMATLMVSGQRHDVVDNFTRLSRCAETLEGQHA